MPDAGKETGYLVSGGFHLVSGGDKGGDLCLPGSLERGKAWERIGMRPDG